MDDGNDLGMPRRLVQRPLRPQHGLEDIGFALLDGDGGLLERPPLPAALDDKEEDAAIALEREIRAQLLGDCERMIVRLTDALKTQPARAVRWLTLLQGYIHRQRALVAELALDDDDEIRAGRDDEGGMVMEAMGDDGMDPFDGRARRRARMRRRHGAVGMAGFDHPYAEPGNGIADALRAQQLDALTRVMERSAPDGPVPNPDVYAAAERQVARLLGVVPPRPPRPADPVAEPVPEE